MRRHAPGRRVRARIAIATHFKCISERKETKKKQRFYCIVSYPTQPPWLCWNGFSRKASIKKFHRLPRYKHRRSGQQGFFLVRFVHTQGPQTHHTCCLDSIGKKVSSAAASRSQGVGFISAHGAVLSVRPAIHIRRTGVTEIGSWEAGEVSIKIHDHESRTHAHTPSLVGRGRSLMDMLYFDRLARAVVY